jgi:DDE domain
VEDLLAERGIIFSYEAIRRWCSKFGPDYARHLKKNQGRLGGTWYLDELFIRINGQQQYLWWAVDQDGDVIDILLQSRRDQRAAERFLRRLLRGQGNQPIPDHHRQAEELCCCRSNDPAKRYPRYPTIWQQSGRDFASAHSDERTTNAPIQITPTSSVLITPRCRPESVSHCATFAEIDSSTTLEISVLRGLANGNGGLTIRIPRL